MLPGLSARGKNVASSCSVEKGCQRMMRLIAWERREFLTWLLAVPDRTEREREKERDYRAPRIFLVSDEGGSLLLFESVDSYLEDLLFNCKFYVKITLSLYKYRETRDFVGYLCWIFSKSKNVSV